MDKRNARYCGHSEALDYGETVDAVLLCKKCLKAEILRLRDYTDRLAEALPDGVLPKDQELSIRADERRQCAEKALEVGRLRMLSRGMDPDVPPYEHHNDHVKAMATESLACAESIVIALGCEPEEFPLTNVGVAVGQMAGDVAVLEDLANIAEIELLAARRYAVGRNSHGQAEIAARMATWRNVCQALVETLRERYPVGLEVEIPVGNEMVRGKVFSHAAGNPGHVCVGIPARYRPPFRDVHYSQIRIVHQEGVDE